MKYNFFVIITIILFIFLAINYFMNTSENFSDKYPITFCTTNNSLGIRYSDNSCVPFGQANDVTSTKQFKHYSDDSENKSKPSASSASASSASASAPAQAQLKDLTTTSSDDDCIEKNINYGEVCRKRNNSNPNYGIKKIESCEKGGKEGVKVTCEKMFFDGKDYNYDEFTYSTGCINDSLDLNTMCNYYMPNDIKEPLKTKGYNLNSAGLNTRLRGKYGDCYTSNGKPDLSKNRGICNFRKFSEIDRVRPFQFENDYNKYTGCQNMENYNFVDDCKKRLNLDNTQGVFADIQGFDCMPGYARAKCVNKNKIIQLPPILQKFKYDSKSNLYPYSLT